MSSGKILISSFPALILAGFLMVTGVNAADYYVSNSGNDASRGNSVELAWQSIDKVNSSDFQPGDRILFAGGQTFVGKLEANDDGNPASRILISSFGTGRAIIDGGTGTAVLIRGDYVTVRNLDCIGDGRESGNTGNGIEASNTVGAEIDSVDVRGFQHSGVRVSGGRNATVTNVHAHENGFAGIYATGNDSVYVGYCVAENNPGDPTVTSNHSGNGILIGGLNDGLIEYCEAFNNGWDMQQSNVNGPVGIWTWNSDGVVIQYCISHDNRTMPEKTDGGGFDLDGGATNCIIQYCYSYDNGGTGYLLCEYTGAGLFANNTVRYCISENDGQSTHNAGILLWDGGGDGFRDCEIYNNVVYNSEGRHGVEMNSMGTNFNFRNNIFVIEGNGQQIRGLSDEGGQGMFQGNCYWTVGEGFSVSGYNDFEAWIQASGQETVDNEIVGMNIDPMLTDAGNGEKLTDPERLPELLAYLLQDESPLIGKGLDLHQLFSINPGVRDFYGNPIPHEAGFDIGVHEHQGTVHIRWARPEKKREIVSLIHPGQPNNDTGFHNIKGQRFPAGMLPGTSGIRIIHGGQP